MTSMAQAQDAQDSDAPEREVIIVTATLRAADVQDIPIAVTAVSPEQLDRQNVQDIKSLTSISPSFNVQSSQTESQGTSIRIRGVGTTGNNTGLESSVGVFIDGVYQSRPGIALGDLLDLERLEILRGPQGTLFGRNTSAGALNLTTKRPNLTKVEAFGNFTYGNYDFFNVQAGVSVPLVNDQLGLRVSGAYRKRDGFLNSVGVPGAESSNRDRYVIRGQLLWEPSSDISIRLIGDYAKATENCCDAVIVRETELQPFFAFHGLPNDGVAVFGQSALNNLQTNSQQFLNNTEQYGFSGELKWDLGPAQMTYIGSYRHFEAESAQESDFVSLNLFSTGRGSTAAAGFPRTGGPIKTMTHELRFQGSAFNDALDFLVGAYYSDEKIDEVQSMTLGTDYQRAVSAGNFGNLAGVNPLFALTALGNGGVPVNAAGNFAVNRFRQDAESFSIFTHNVFNITDNLSLTLGARYVDEKKQGSFDQLAANSPACQAIVNGVITGAVPAALRGGALGATCFPFATSVGLTVPGTGGTVLASTIPGLPLPREFNRVFKDDELTYTAQIAYNTNNGFLAYAGFSHGFKSGGFNLDPAAAANGANPAFNSEKVDAYEAGIKTEFANGRIRANLALFHMDMTDFQVLEFTGVQFQTFNVAAAKSTGAELEMFGQFDSGISVNVAVTYADARYPGNCANGVVGNAATLQTVRSLCGADLTNAPKFNGVAGITYDNQITDSGWKMLANFNINYSDDRRTSTSPLDTNGLPIPLDIQQSYFKMNARLGFTTPDDRFSFELWGTNLNNEITRGITANTPLRGGAGTRSRIGFVEEPRMYGITLRAKY
ncbi:TonB-dependent receptor [Blastomonas fulva]|uniref:TonB-dependent receptor n=1 Tax=Blastomonas fulva TaxID=1550728 RepID=UPI0025A3A893|nr:TonB-dependent receptor [Blastomonas fulva]MDM7964837.1 TonB-dependent receptor [Blastomonas fulva]